MEKHLDTDRIQEIDATELESNLDELWQTLEAKLGNIGALNLHRNLIEAAKYNYTQQIDYKSKPSLLRFIANLEIAEDLLAGENNVQYIHSLKMQIAEKLRTSNGLNLIIAKEELNREMNWARSQNRNQSAIDAANHVHYWRLEGNGQSFTKLDGEHGQHYNGLLGLLERKAGAWEINPNDFESLTSGLKKIILHYRLTINPRPSDDEGTRLTRSGSAYCTFISLVKLYDTLNQKIQQNSRNVDSLIAETASKFVSTV